MAQIHPSSLVDPQAKLAENVVVGPFCTIGPHVEVGEGTTLQSHIVLTGHTKIGKNNKIYAFAAIGIDPQDKKYRGEETQLIIGDNNVIREHCTLSVGTVQDKGVTIVGNGNLLMSMSPMTASSETTPSLPTTSALPATFMLLTT